MNGTKLYNPKHASTGYVTNDPITKRGYYTVHYNELGMYRRYSKDKIIKLANLTKELDNAVFTVNGKEVYKQRANPLVLGMPQVSHEREPSTLSKMKGILINLCFGKRGE